MLQNMFVLTDRVRELVQGALKCGCPESVFDDVRIGLPSLYDTHDVEGGLEILVGRRLLVAIVPLERVGNPETDIPLILERGRCVRDERGFNRYRLVVVGVRETNLRAKMQGLSSTLDERLHIHLLEEGDLRQD